ncbi:putative pilus assembly protein FilE [Acinetobacter baumannii]|uniref:putative pilus assembly protein FilE n=1 Tax=Acinetobacter baumannii TaxID=470 RepID=UPI000D6705E0|nr:putative pilus assembly protein FilE [Acinetobacter baumannii]EHU1604296.1 putative pilus assembly protein FilE [Acinetobacter baumannii]EKU5653786.1 putative pilus assembly protein FilE [Acinetobacter baumannii]MBP3067820.1 putative pilus assembly protein FilE [Acinetobacter baumannii]MDG6216905.1 putative pilus assembly protein FilE [Acinetobacter baumannii]MDK3065317.1 putative pilus assembly protein FilE [Acinetobacter baumannii]
MVRLYKWMFSPKFAITTLCVAIASISVSYADGFYTIIGPDGRPMIVPSKRIDQKKQPIPKIEEKKPQTQQNQPIVDAVQKTSKEKEQTKNLPKKLEQHVQEKLNTAPTAPQKTQKNTKTVSVVSDDLKTSTEKNKIIESGNAPSVSNNEWQKKLVLVPPPIKSTSQAAPSSDSSLDKSKFTTIDGVEYVNNEYLEDQEFNIEGKKRFYLMPDGLGRTESVERKKGVSRSTLDQLFNRQTQDQDSTVVLAPTYMRLSSQELEAAFEQDKCFIKDYKKSIKTLSTNKEVNLWPRKPLKEKFEYELVQLNPSVQHLKVMSFASSNEKPLYYWPLVVFLDDKGCILEGVSGFKSKSYPSTMLQHASIQGVLKVPPSAHYIMMTPLSSAVDVTEKELTNQGQIQISVLR